MLDHYVGIFVCSVIVVTRKRVHAAMLVHFVLACVPILLYYIAYPPVSY
jgi:hypothetical protein